MPTATSTLTADNSSTTADRPVTIIKGGDEAVQVPRAIMEADWTKPPSAREWKTFMALLWCAYREEYWEPAAAALDEPALPAPLLIEAAAVRDAAGYAADHDLGGLYDALDGLTQRGLIDLETRRTMPVVGYKARHGRRWLDVWFGPDIVDCHRDIREYGLVNLDHVRALRTPLDCIVYNEATLVAKRRNPRFKLNVPGTATRGGIAQGCNWAALGRPFRQALQRVADATGARFACLAYSRGRLPGIDTIEVHVGHVATPHRARFRKERRRLQKEFVIEGRVAADDPVEATAAALKQSPQSLAAPAEARLSAAPLSAGDGASPADRPASPTMADDIPF